MKPLIGVMGNRIPNRDPLFQGMERDYVNHDYIHAIEECGGIPVILPITKDPELLIPFIDRIDGLLLSGGYDIHPSIYGEAPHPLLQYADKGIDIVQLALVQYAISIKKPILGVCRGLQLLTIAGGGTLYQDISLAQKNPIQHFQNAKRWEATHNVTISPSSILAKNFGSEIMTNSYHHCCMRDCPESFRITAMASDDIPEAIEYKGSYQFIIGVQWHPEMMMVHSDSMRPLFESFISAATPRP